MNCLLCLYILHYKMSGGFLNLSWAFRKLYFQTAFRSASAEIILKLEWIFKLNIDSVYEGNPTCFNWNVCIALCTFVSLPHDTAKCLWFCSVDQPSAKLSKVNKTWTKVYSLFIMGNLCFSPRPKEIYSVLGHRGWKGKEREPGIFFFFFYFTGLKEMD